MIKNNIHQLFKKRNSPRIMGGKNLTVSEIIPLFEAARWAPSSYNSQLWRFVYARKGTKYWKPFLNLFNTGNKKWAQNASVLVVVLTRKRFEYDDRPSRTAAFDAGAACENLSLEAVHQNLAVHLLEGFDYTKAAKIVKAPKTYKILAMIAIGRKSKQKEKRTKRRPLKEIISEGKLKNLR
jgi:nitroreductase